MSTTAPTPVPENPQPSPAAAPVADKRKTATGVIPKQMQSWIFLAIIGVVAVGLWFSSSAPKAKAIGSNGPAAGEQVRPTVTGFTTDQLQHRLEQTELAHQTALSNPTLNQTGRPPDSATGQDATAPGTNSTAQPPAPVTDPIAEDERKREYVPVLLRMLRCLTAPTRKAVIPALIRPPEYSAAPAIPRTWQ
jgi:hypothetical protein